MANYTSKGLTSLWSVRALSKIVLDPFFFLYHVRRMLRLRGGNERGRKVGGGGVDVIIISLYKKPGGQKVDEQEVAEMQPALWCSEERVE